VNTKTDLLVFTNCIIN